MAGSFSGHLISSFHSNPQFVRGPFGGQPSPPVVTHGPMSFSPQMHGAFGTQASVFSDSSLMDVSEETAKRIATLQAKLNKKLGPEYISQRPGPGGGPKLTYAEGWKIINLANEVFGFNGWSSNVVSLTTDFIDQNDDSKRFTVGVTAIIRITLRDGVFHEDIGYGMLENSKSKGAALDKCKKEAVTDGVKRALRNFGNLLGNCLYDKSYTQEVIKIKVPPPKFERSELHRRPEYEEVKPDVQPMVGASVKTEPTAIRNNNPSVPSRLVASAIPPHVRNASGSNQVPIPPSAAASTPNIKGKAPMGMQTPAYTPANEKIGRPNAGPSHIQQPPRNPVPPQNPPAPAPAVPAVSKKLTIDDDDDAFQFYSEDDAFLATVDLGEGDEGIGGPIDFDEGTRGAEVSVESIPDAPAVGAREAAIPPPQKQEVRQQPRPAQPAAAQPRTTAALQSRPSFTTASVIQKQYTSISNPSADQNIPPQQSTAGSTSVGTPTGGFRFPQSANQQPSRAPTNAGANGVGMKRSADVMRAQSAAPARRPAQGMGLTNPAPASAMVSVPMGGAGWPAPQMKREPFAALEVGEGGDVKRMRR